MVYLEICKPQRLYKKLRKGNVRAYFKLKNYSIRCPSVHTN